MDYVDSMTRVGCIKVKFLSGEMRQFLHYITVMEFDTKLLSEDKSFWQLHLLSKILDTQAYSINV